eukprot:COSAG01_NODE_26685_length_706_cov_0.843493_1_plen_108_part_00
MGSDAGSDSGSRGNKYMVSAQPEKSGAMVSRGGTLPGLSPEKSAGGLDKDSIMKFYKKRTILPQEKLGAAADLKRTQKDMGFAQDDFRLDPEEVCPGPYPRAHAHQF